MPHSITLALILVVVLLLFSFRKSRHRHRPRPTQGFISIQGQENGMSFNIKAGQTGVATATFTDANLVVRPLPAGSVVVWAVSPPDALVIGAVDPASPLSVGITGGAGAPGDFALTATTEGDPTPGVDTIVATIAGTLVEPEDTQGTIDVVLS